MRGNDNKERYYTLDIETKKLSVFANGILDSFGDGHPSFKERIVITDTYPNKARNKSLIKVFIDDEKYEILGTFYESFKYKDESRCDLHPRFIDSENMISIDSVHEGKRCMYLVKNE
ncbi:MAG: hypothetical protein ACFFDF_10330 [Candidatus Odinarchaeota archaeon]